MLGGVVQMLSPQPGAWPANKAQITGHRTRSVASQTPQRRATRYLFLRSPTNWRRDYFCRNLRRRSAVNETSFRPPKGGFFMGAIWLKQLPDEKGSSSSRTPTEQPDDLQSIAKAKILVALGEGSLLDSSPGRISTWTERRWRTPTAPKTSAALRGNFARVLRPRSTFRAFPVQKTKSAWEPR